MEKAQTTRLNVVKNIFTNLDNPAAYTGAERVFREAKKIDKKITRADVRDQLEASRTYTLHKPQRIKYKRLKTVPNGYMSDMQADLADFQKVAYANDDYRYLLVCVEVLSRKVYTAPVKSKSPPDMIVAFDKLFQDIPYLPLHLFTDKGLEFEANQMRAYFRRRGIQKYVAQSDDVKAALAERYILSIKKRLWKYFSETQSHRWVDVVPKIVAGINNSINRNTGMRPNDVTADNADELWDRMYLDENARKYRYKEGDYVRIGRAKGVFEKGYVPNYTQEVFKIDQVKAGSVPNYRLVDSKGEQILGKFYEHNFSKAKHEPNKVYVIEKVLNERIRAGKPEYLVKWRGLPKKFSTWVRRDDIL